MDLKGLIDMAYFWWVFAAIMGFGVIFLIIYIAIQSAGLVLETLIKAFNNMRKG